MKPWITTLIAGACMTVGASALLAEPTDAPGGPGGRMQRKGPAGAPAPADRPAPGDRQRLRDREGAGPGGPGPDGPRPPALRPGPLMIALDTDKDGVLSATEIAAASENLKKLDKNGDGKIDRVELLPPPLRRPQDGQGPRGGANAQDGPRPRPRGDAAPAGPRPAPRGDAAPDGPRPGPRGPRPGDRRPPVPPAPPQE